MPFNQKGHLVDNGREVEKRTKCHNCGGENTIVSTVSRHFCIICPAAFDYWHYSPNPEWDNHIKLERKILDQLLQDRLDNEEH